MKGARLKTTGNEWDSRHSRHVVPLLVWFFFPPMWFHCLRDAWCAALPKHTQQEFTALHVCCGAVGFPAAGELCEAKVAVTGGWPKRKRDTHKKKKYKRNVGKKK